VLIDREPLVLAGLGNPGKKYENTRHNLGFMLADKCQELFAPDSDKKWRDKYDSQVVETQYEGQRLILCKPQTYMNLSGKAVVKLIKSSNATLDSLVVAYDDIDLPLGALRLKKGGGDGGHRGLRSIIDSVGSPEFVRLRMGVGRPEESDREQEVSDWVLKKLSKDDLEVVSSLVDKAAQAVREYLSHGLKTTQNFYNK
jgi:PTH1 family peptidyl-tRNA hydrolase